MGAKADWYQDPENPGLSRWWDGESWTDHRQTILPAWPSPTRLPEDASEIAARFAFPSEPTYRKAPTLVLAELVAAPVTRTDREQEVRRSHTAGYLGLALAVVVGLPSLCFALLGLTKVL